MISLGAEFATDLSALDAAQAAAVPPADGAGPFASPDADLFNAVLGQMMGQEEAALDPGAGVERDMDAPVEDDADAATDIDPTELVNPIVAVGQPPAAQPVATLVWTILTVPTAVAASITADASPAAVEAPAEIDLPVEAREGMDMPAAIEHALDVDAAPTPADERATAPGSRLQAIDIKNDAMPSGIAVERQPAETADVASASGLKPQAAPSPGIAEAINRGDRASRPSKAEKIDKAPVEPKLEAAGIHPVPFVAVERAYSGNEQGGRSFDAPKEQPQLTGTAGSSPQTVAATPAFVVPAEGRTLLSAPPGVIRQGVDIPVAMARDIDTHVPAQIVQSIRLQAINGGGEAIIRLNPDYLGEVVVAVKVEQGNVTASLQAETPAVRQWVERNEPVLRQALAEQGLQLDKLTVAEKASESEREGARDDAREDAREEHSQQQSRRRRPQSDEATFEVTV